MRCKKYILIDQKAIEEVVVMFVGCQCFVCQVFLSPLV